MQRFITALVLISALLGATHANAGHISYPKEKLTVATTHGDVQLSAEIATSEIQIEHGLMFRKKVTPMAGMLFLFPANRSLDMWMKNTYVSLDMFFIDEHGKITGIAENTTPLSEARIHSDYDVKAVLEMVAGSAKRLNIAKGDKIVYPALQ